jgi:FAD/FMN-containing dehydrogenase
VTGFDLHRRYTGSQGTLCVILEASLRLHALPRSRAVLLASATSRERALEAARAVLASRARPWLVTCHDLVPAREEKHWTISALLAGSSAAVAFEAAELRALLPEARVFGGEEHRSPCDRMSDELRDLESVAGGWPHVVLECLPTRVEAVLAHVDRALLAARVEARILVHPGLATVACWFRSRDGSAISEREAVAFETALAGVDARHHWRNAPLAWRRSVRVLGDDPSAPPAGFETMRALKLALDPLGVFAGGRYVGGL